MVAVGGVCVFVDVDRGDLGVAHQQCLSMAHVWNQRAILEVQYPLVMLRTVLPRSLLFDLESALDNEVFINIEHRVHTVNGGGYLLLICVC